MGLIEWMTKPEAGNEQSVFVPFVSEGVYHPRKGTRRYLTGKQNQTIYLHSNFQFRDMTYDQYNPEKCIITPL